MNKQEIEHRIKKYELIRECAEENLNDLNIQLRDLREAEKPKLRHGDCGYSEAGDRCLTLRAQNPPVMRRASAVYLYEEVIHNKNFFITNVAFNIFDLLKEWSEDLDRTNIDGFVLEICGDRIVIGGRRFLIVQAEEIWHKLGQLIATLKRKSKTG